MNRWDIHTLGWIGAIVFGIGLILLRKRISRQWWNKSLKKAKPRDRDMMEQLEKTGFERPIQKVEEIAILVFALTLVIFGLCKFVPSLNKYVNYGFKFFVLSIFAVGGAGIVIFFLLPVFTKKLNQYRKENYAESYLRARCGSVSERLGMIKSSQQTDDPILRKLQIKAAICTGACFFLIYIVLLVAFYTFIRVTS
jgi:hypothetical protein